MPTTNPAARFETTPSMHTASELRRTETVSVLIHEHSARIKNGDMTYVVRIYASERTDRTGEGWLQFHPTDKSKPVLRTAQETSQPRRDTIEYWALG